MGCYRIFPIILSKIEFSILIKSVLDLESNYIKLFLIKKYSLDEEKMLLWAKIYGKVLIKIKTILQEIGLPIYMMLLVTFQPIIWSGVLPSFYASESILPAFYASESNYFKPLACNCPLEQGKK